MFAVNFKDNFDCVNAPIHDMRLFLVQTNDEFFSKFTRILELISNPQRWKVNFCKMTYYCIEMFNIATNCKYKYRVSTPRSHIIIW
jgi:hypothetical protein